MLETLAKVAGVGGLTVGVMYLLYKEIIKRNIFTALTSGQTFVIFILLTISIFLITSFAILRGDGMLVIGRNNVVNDGINPNISSGSEATSK
jgi:hypothetical protein